MTNAERDHLCKIARIGCIVCLEQGHGPTPAEIHHPRRGQGMGQKASHFEAIPLCHAHHRTGGFGVAIHAGQKTWEAHFGTEAELLEKTRARIGHGLFGESRNP